MPVDFYSFFQHQEDSFVFISGESDKTGSQGAHSGGNLMEIGEESGVSKKEAYFSKVQQTEFSADIHSGYKFCKLANIHIYYFVAKKTY